MIEIHTEYDSDASAVICRPVGPLDLEAAAVLSDHLGTLMKSQLEVVIDLGRVDSVGEDAFTLLVVRLRRARAFGGTTLLVNPQGQVREHLQLIGAYPSIFGDAVDDTA